MKRSDALSLIGNTPLIKLGDTNMYAKMEKYNLTGSIKDRAALKIIDTAIKENKINSDTTIIEATSGNMGISIACICKIKKLKCIIVMPNNMSNERIELIKAYGAKVILTDSFLGMNGAVEKAKELKLEINNSFVVSQFNNYNSVLAHYDTTAREIIKELKNVDCVIAGIGTASTIMGISKYLKKYNKNIHIIGVEPLNSPLLNFGNVGVHKIQGIGPNFISPLLEKKLIDEIIDISDSNAYEGVKELVNNYGVFVGISSGAVYKAGLKVQDKYQNIVLIFPDGGERYLSVDGLIWLKPKILKKW